MTALLGSKRFWVTLVLMLGFAFSFELGQQYGQHSAEGDGARMEQSLKQMDDQARREYARQHRAGESASADARDSF